MLEIKYATEENAIGLHNFIRHSWHNLYVNQLSIAHKEDVDHYFTHVNTAENMQHRLTRERQLGVSACKLVMTQEGEIGGVSWPFTDNRARARVGALYVSDELKGCGLGSQLYLEAEQQLAGKDLYCIVSESNERAADFFKSHGFMLTGATETLELSPAAVIIGKELFKPANG